MLPTLTPRPLPLSPTILFFPHNPLLPMLSLNPPLPSALPKEDIMWSWRKHELWHETHQTQSRVLPLLFPLSNLGQVV